MSHHVTLNYRKVSGAAEWSLGHWVNAEPGSQILSCGKAHSEDETGTGCHMNHILLGRFSLALGTMECKTVLGREGRLVMELENKLEKSLKNETGQQ